MNAPPKMQPVAAAAEWDVPIIETVGDLADWLSLTPDQLLWFADLKGLTYKTKSSRSGTITIASWRKNPAPFD